MSNPARSPSRFRSYPTALKILALATIAVIVFCFVLAASRPLSKFYRHRIEGADPIALRGVQLRKELDGIYEDLDAHKLLKRQNDVTATVLKYIPVGTTFDDATRVLRAAGCRVGYGPVIDTLPVDEQRRLSHVDASLPMSNSLLDFGNSFFVMLYPPKPGDYRYVASLDAVIISTDL